MWIPFLNCAVEITAAEGSGNGYDVVNPTPTIGSMRIEVLYFDGCPSYEGLLPRLRSLLEREGVEEPIELRQVETPEAAERERFLGSPTVRIDGEDSDPGASTRSDFGLKCRLYRDGNGATGGVPPDQLLVDAIRRAKQR